MTYKPKPLHVKFSDAPPIGTVFVVKGHEYEIKDVRPHTRRDGGETSVIAWGGKCIQCGDPFVQTTGRSFTSFMRRCEPCRVIYMNRSAERDNVTA